MICEFRAYLPVMRHAAPEAIRGYSCAHPTATPDGTTTPINCQACNFNTSREVWTPQQPTAAELEYTRAMRAAGIPDGCTGCG